MPAVKLAEVADHIEHIRKVAGIDYVGIGSDLRGIEAIPQGLEEADKFPDLLAELMRRGWSDDDVAKVAGGNLLRAMTAAKEIAAKLSPLGCSRRSPYKSTASTDSN